ncbi:fatty acid desaturase [Planococcaceae bacterium Storch 2/2-2]|nr:fatty acid desaturase [Planococcaceae bacterium Storch 2/2-2]
MSKQQTKELHKSVAPYAKCDTKKSVWQLINTIPPFFILWYIAYEAYQLSFWLMIPVAVVAAGFVVRTFIIFHDCTHGSFFKSKKATDFVGTLTGIMTLFPYEQWKREHSIHHATSSNLDKRGTGDIWVMTIEEYAAANKWTRLGYRLYRNPIVMFGFGPLYLILVSNRFNRKGVRPKEFWNTHLTNAAIVLIYGLMMMWIGVVPFLAIQGTIMFVAAGAGIWLFFIQHTFEDSYFEEQGEWNYVKAAIDGSSYYELPKVLQFMTGNIGFHHVHHLAPRVPNYHLEDAHENIEPLQQATKITIGSSLRSLKYKLYDNDKKAFITFKEMRERLERGEFNALKERGRVSAS